MSDLVKRLLAHADGLEPLGAPVVAKDILDAADELKRLTAEVAKLRQIEVDGDIEIERQSKEIERLRSEAHKNDRWNVETTQDGFRICYGYHEKSEGCQWKHFVPRAT